MRKSLYKPENVQNLLDLCKQEDETLATQNAKRVLSEYGLPTKKLEKCKRLGNYTEIPVPSYALKKRLRNLDKFLMEAKDRNKGS